ncbi:potassium channel family protein [Solimonas terrae]|nr:potassium channel protein [Solimonas terrae]
MSLSHSPSRNLVNGLLFLAVLAPIAVLAYMLLGWSFGDALYMVVVTIFTVGYEEVRPIDTPELRAVTVALIVLGCTGVIYLTGALVQFFTLSQIQQVLGIKRMKSEIDQLQAHVIVCGFGRIGNMLTRELKAGKTRFVIIERSEPRVAEARDLGYLWVQGEATDEAVLKSAGIDRAAILATVLPDDAANVFITLSARSLNKNLRIIARGELPTTEGKLLHAGANEVVLPAHIGAERIAEMILFRNSTTLVRGSEQRKGFEQDLHGLGLELEVTAAAEGSPFVGLSIAEIERRAGGAFLIVALNRRDGSSLTRPPSDAVIGAGDGVVVIGRSGRVRALDAFAQAADLS